MLLSSTFYVDIYNIYYYYCLPVTIVISVPVLAPIFIISSQICFSCMNKDSSKDMSEQTAGEVDKTKQIQGNVLTNMTKNKETIVHKCFQQQPSSEGVRRETHNGFNIFVHQLLLVCPLLLLPVSLLTPEEDFFCWNWKRSCIVSLHLVALVSTFPQTCFTVSSQHSKI